MELEVRFTVKEKALNTPLRLLIWVKVIYFYILIMEMKSLNINLIIKRESFAIRSK